MTTSPVRPFVLLEDSLSPAGRCRLFRNPERIIRCDDPSTLEDALRQIEAAVREGFHLAGFLSYELGYLFEPRLAGLLPQRCRQPLLWLGVFRGGEDLASSDVPDLLGGGAAAPFENARLSLDRADYLARFARAKDYIAAGDIYQVNLTFKHLFNYAGDPLALYRDLRRQQRVRHGALIAADDFHLLSFSPEQFLHCAEGVATMRPMKGTMARGRTPAEDASQAAFLRADAKSRAENLMILDLMRNDLGRIATVGSVSVTDMFTVETYRTLHQMTSGVTARLRPDVGIADLLRHVFPCGSVTGAPKIRAMEIIRELEDGPRGAYTGSVGVIGPGGAIDLNVAIRTLCIDADGVGELGVGSGIVQDLDGPAEFEECLLKGRFATAGEPPFQLIETMRWEREGGYWLLDGHLERLAASAGYFGFSGDIAGIRSALATAAAGFREPVQRVRLTLDEDGAIRIAAVPIAVPLADAVMRYAIAEEPTASSDRFLFHKTTRRQFYDSTRERLALVTGCDEVLFVNERGELTEGSFTNLFVEREGRLLTPPLASGLLNGTLRRHLLADPRHRVQEAVLYPEDLQAADGVYLGNSVRGLVRATEVDGMADFPPGNRAVRANVGIKFNRFKHLR